jgi:NADH-quinone oxidoreductase subunit L
MYGKGVISPQSVVRALAVPHTLLQQRYYIDQLYDWYVRNVQQQLVAGLCSVVERVVVIGLMVNGTAWLTQGCGRLLRLCQTGRIQTYVLVFLLGIVWLLSAFRRW